MEGATRFARLTRGQSLSVLAATVLALLFAAILYQPQPPAPPPVDLVVDTPVVTEIAAPVDADVDAGRDTDLALYDAIKERVAGGENYYAVAVEEQRARNFPVRPGLAVRLPTLAHISAMLGPIGVLVAAAVLLVALLWAWWRRLAPLVERTPRRIMALGLLGLGFATGFKPMYFVLHEVWAGMLLALALALHSPGKWRGAWVAAALALSIREHALPFVLLMGALSLWRRDWREFGAWSALVAGFLILLWIHVSTVASYTTEADPLSSSWLALRGLNGWLDAISLNSALYHLPSWIAGPLVLLPLLGWAALRDRLGCEATLLFVGYGVFFMLAGRENNFYWGLVVVPAWFVGLYWMPFALRDLVSSAQGSIART